MISNIAGDENEGITTLHRIWMRHTRTHKYNYEGKKPDIKGLTYLYINIFIIYINIIIFLPTIMLI